MWAAKIAHLPVLVSPPDIVFPSPCACRYRTNLRSEHYECTESLEFEVFVSSSEWVYLLSSHPRMCLWQIVAAACESVEMIGWSNKPFIMSSFSKRPPLPFQVDCIFLHVSFSLTETNLLGLDARVFVSFVATVISVFLGASLFGSRNFACSLLTLVGFLTIADVFI
jgi:hypothetical protein